MNIVTAYTIFATIVLFLCLRAMWRRLKRIDATIRLWGLLAARARARDSLGKLIRDAREWPPEADVPVPYLPAEVSDFDQWQAELEDEQ